MHAKETEQIDPLLLPQSLRKTDYGVTLLPKYQLIIDKASEKQWYNVILVTYTRKLRQREARSFA